MRLMRGASVESGVVRVLFGVGERRAQIKSKVKNPTPSASSGQALNRTKRDLEWGTLEVPNTFGSLDTLEVPGSLGETFSGGTSLASTRSQSTATANPTSTSADRSVRATHVTYKRLGERAEAAFLAKVAGLGFGVAKPWGDSDRYDFIVDAGGRLWRVQVKSAHRAGQDGGYNFRMYGHSLGAYKDVWALAWGL